MQIYLDLVVILNFCVDFLLLLATNRLTGYPPSPMRLCFAALLGGGYAGACMLRGFGFLGNLFWRLVFLALIARIAFGWNHSALRRGVLFSLLSMALGGLALALGKGGFGALVVSAGLIFLMSTWGLAGAARGRGFLPVEITHRGKKVKITALYDSGNTLNDPITGQSVTILGPELAWDLFGLTKEQLLHPIETVEEGKIAGLRLIPYRSVGQPMGMLLLASMEEVKIGGVLSGKLVAFSPNALSGAEGYQALTGGCV